MTTAVQHQYKSDLETYEPIPAEQWISSPEKQKSSPAPDSFSAGFPGNKNRSIFPLLNHPLWHSKINQDEMLNTVLNPEQIDKLINMAGQMRRPIERSRAFVAVASVENLNPQISSSCIKKALEAIQELSYLQEFHKALTLVKIAEIKSLDAQSRNAYIEEAIAMADQSHVEGEGYTSDVLKKIARLKGLSQEQIRKLVKTANSRLSEGHFKTNLLAHLSASEGIDPANKEFIQQETVSSLFKIPEIWNLYDGLLSVIGMDFLNKEQIDQVIGLAEKLTNNYEKAIVLSRLAQKTYLKTEIKKQCLQKALEAVDSNQDHPNWKEWVTAEVLRNSAAASELNRKQVLYILKKADSIQSDFYRCQIFVEIAANAHLEKNLRMLGQKKALSSAQSPSVQAWVHIALAKIRGSSFQDKEHHIQDAIEASNKIESELRKYLSLLNICKLQALTTRHLASLIEVAQNMGESVYKALLLITIGNHPLAQVQQKSACLSTALSTARGLEDAYSRSVAFANIATLGGLQNDLRVDCIQKSLAAARQIKKNDNNLLQAIARISEIKNLDKHSIDGLIELAELISDHSFRASALAVISRA